MTLVSKPDEIHVFRNIDDNVIYKGELTERRIDMEPNQSSYLKLELSEAQTGTLFLYGSSDETISFDGSKYGETDNLYTSVDGMTPTDLSGEITMRAVNKSGEFIKRLTFSHSFNGSYNTSTKSQYFRTIGFDKDFKGRVIADGDADIKLHDLIKINKVDADEYFEVDMISEPSFHGKVENKQIFLIKANV